MSANTSTKDIYWWHVYNESVAGFDFNEMFVTMYNGMQTSPFCSYHDAFQDFKLKNSALIAGETLADGHYWNYKSGMGTGISIPNGTIILKKPDGTVAFMLCKTVPMLSIAIATPIHHRVLSELGMGVL